MSVFHLLICTFLSVRRTAGKVGHTGKSTDRSSLGLSTGQQLVELHTVPSLLFCGFLEMK